MNHLRLSIISILLFFLILGCKKEEDTVFTPPPGENGEVDIPPIVQLLTTANEAKKFEIEKDGIDAYKEGLGLQIDINPAVEFQEIEGFGFAITGGTAEHISAMSQTAQSTLLNELFGTGEGQIGMSFIRISLGASDLNSTVFSYNDLPDGQTDINQELFSLAPDEQLLIPVLKKIVAINPSISIMASPWSPPVWMKDNQSSIGGSLIPDYYESYALYLLRYIQEMDKQGITITHLTVQNEPLHGGNNPSMYMKADEQSDFIKNHLGPLFSENDIQTKIIIYDHNPDRTDFPLSILGDIDAKDYVAGSAFHLYAGDISALSVVRNTHPNKGIYFTEQWYGAPGNFSEDLKWHTREVVIGAQRNWSRNVIEWNLSSNENFTPHTDGGCTQCMGGITIEGDNVKRNAGYYVIAHVSQQVIPQSIRINSNYINELPNVAFITPDNKIVLLVLNDSDVRQEFNVVQDSIKYSTFLDPGSVSTYVWTVK